MPGNKVIDFPLFSAEGGRVCRLDGMNGGMSLIVLTSYFGCFEFIMKQLVNILMIVSAVLQSLY